jgi:hypothetical protein
MPIKPTQYYVTEFAYPNYADLPVFTKQKIEKAEASLKNISGELGNWFYQDVAAFNLGNIERMSPNSILLSHELSDYFMDQGEHVRIDGVRTESERRVLQKGIVSYSFPYISLSSEFICELESLASHLLGEECLIRTGGLRCQPDRGNKQWVFTPPSRIAERLIGLHIYLNRNRSGLPSLFSAVVAIVTIWFCHPFRDANGRVGRCLFQIILRFGGLPLSTTLPLRELFSLSRGGFLIRARQVITRNDWIPILDFFCNLIFICAQDATYQSATPGTL